MAYWLSVLRLIMTPGVGWYAPLDRTLVLPDRSVHISNGIRLRLLLMGGYLMGGHSVLQIVELILSTRMRRASERVEIIDQRDDCRFDLTTVHAPLP